VNRPPKDLGASVQARLRNLARERGEDVQIVLLQFVIERLLHRLACSPHRREFVLKGAMLFTAWTKIAHRASRDLDLLGSGPADLPRLAAIFRTISRVRAAQQVARGRKRSCFGTGAAADVPVAHRSCAARATTDAWCVVALGAMVMTHAPWR
jgi:hypothetical protein